MKKEKCQHINKAYSRFGTQTNNGNTTYWICKDCGFEGSDFTPNYDEYEEIKRRFSGAK